MFCREQRENTLSLIKLRLQGNMLYCLKSTKWSTATCMSFCTFGKLVAYTAYLPSCWKVCVCVHRIMEKKTKISLRTEAMVAVGWCSCIALRAQA